jgi:hypothetical protein
MVVNIVSSQYGFLVVPVVLFLVDYIGQILERALGYETVVRRKKAKVAHEGPIVPPRKIEAELSRKLMETRNALDRSEEQQQFLREEIATLTEMCRQLHPLRREFIHQIEKNDQLTAQLMKAMQQNNELKVIARGLAITLFKIQQEQPIVSPVVVTTEIVQGTCYDATGYGEPRISFIDENHCPNATRVM